MSDDADKLMVRMPLSALDGLEADLRALRDEVAALRAERAQLREDLHNMESKWSIGLPPSAWRLARELDPPTRKGAPNA